MCSCPTLSPHSYRTFQPYQVVCLYGLIAFHVDLSQSYPICICKFNYPTTSTIAGIQSTLGRLHGTKQVMLGCFCSGTAADTGAIYY